MVTVELDDDLMVKDKNVCYITLDNWDNQFNFKEIYENEYYTIIDKQQMGEQFGRELIDGLDKDEVYVDGEFTEDFIDNVLTIIEEDCINKLRNEICEFVLEYIGNNL